MDDNNETSSAFQDFIPAGEDPGAITESGFSDFVPAPQPELQDVSEEEVSEPEVTEEADVDPNPLVVEDEGEAEAPEEDVVEETPEVNEESEEETEDKPTAIPDPLPTTGIPTNENSNWDNQISANQVEVSK